MLTMPQQAYRCKVLTLATFNMFEFNNFFIRGNDNRAMALYNIQQERKWKKQQQAKQEAIQREEAVFSIKSSVKKPFKMNLRDMIQLEKPLDQLKLLRKTPKQIEDEDSVGSYQNIQKLVNDYS